MHGDTCNHTGKADGYLLDKDIDRDPCGNAASLGEGIPSSFAAILTRSATEPTLLGNFHEHLEAGRARPNGKLATPSTTTKDAPEGVDPSIGDIAYYARWGNGDILQGLWLFKRPNPNKDSENRFGYEAAHYTLPIVSRCRDCLGSYGTSANCARSARR
jgi:hypothetical protein